VSKDVSYNYYNLSGHHSKDELRKSDQIGTAEQPNLIQYSDDELDDVRIILYLIIRHVLSIGNGFTYLK